MHLPFLDGIDLNFSFFIALFYAVSAFPSTEMPALSPLSCLLCWFGSKSLAGRLGFSLAWKVVLATHLFCWAGQFIGHGVFEVLQTLFPLQKRAPTLLDNLSQALMMAPFFVLLELLQSVFGYEPYPGFHANVAKKMEAGCLAARKQKKSC